MASPTLLLLLLCWFMTHILFILFLCVATLLYGLIKHIKCMNQKKKVRDAHFLRLNVNDSYNYNMNSVDLSDKHKNVYQVDHWMRNNK